MLFKKMWRDTLHYKTQFISIFVMIFLGVFIYTGINSEWNGLLTHSQNFYDETNLSDGLFIGKSFTKEDVAKLKTNEDIQEVERRAIFQAHPQSNKKKSLNIYLIEEMSLSQMKIMKGESYHPNKSGIWINQNYADQNNIKIGDKIVLEKDGMVIEEVVKGVVLHPEHVYTTSEGGVVPDYKNQGYAFIAANTFAYTNKIPFTQLMIQSDTPHTESLVKKTLNNRSLTYIDKEDFPSYSMIHNEIIQHQAFANVFPIVFLFIAILTTITTITKLIFNQRLQIGVLKAFGLCQRKIFIHYLSHILVITILAAFLGYLLGPLIVPEIIYPMMRTIYVLPQIKAVPLDTSIFLVISMILISFIISFIICFKQLRENASKLMRPVIIQYIGKQNTKGKIWSHLRFYEQWNVRDIMRNKVRSLITIVGIAGCMGLLYCAFGLQDSMINMMDMTFTDLNQFEMQVDINQDANIESIKQRMDGSSFQQEIIEIKSENTTKTHSMIIQEDTRYMKMVNTDLKEISLPQKGITLSYNIAKMYDLRMGDPVKWRLIGEDDWSESRLQEIIHTPTTQGITISKDVYENTNHEYHPSSIVGKGVNLRKEDGIINIKYLQEDIRKGTDTMMESMNLMIAILILAAVVLGSVVLYNIGNFAYVEKTRDMATLKVLGFQNTQIKKILKQQNFILTSIGICLGIPFGYYLIYIIFSTIGESMDVIIAISALTYFICIVGTLLLSMLVMIIVTKKVRDIDMVSALKSIE